jgi:hypothetical protein
VAFAARTHVPSLLDSCPSTPSAEAGRQARVPPRVQRHPSRRSQRPEGTTHSTARSLGIQPCVKSLRSSYTGLCPVILHGVVSPEKCATHPTARRCYPLNGQKVLRTLRPVSATHSTARRYYPLTHSTARRYYPLTHSAARRYYPLTHSTARRYYPLTHSTARRCYPLKHQEMLPTMHDRLLNHPHGHTKTPA